VKEHDIQKEFFKWIEIMKLEEPILGLIVANPNSTAGTMPFRTWNYFKTEGAFKKGYPDVTCPFGSKDGRYTALIIEFKTTKGRVSPEQADYLNLFAYFGALCAVCRDAPSAQDLLMHYIKEDLAENKKKEPPGWEAPFEICNN